MIRFTFACALAILVGSANGQELIVAFNPGSNETVTVDSGTYASAGVGYQGTGTLINNGAFIGGISLGYEGHGTYVQNGPSASVISLATSDYMELAFSGIGTVLQNGGTISYAGRIRMGQHLASSRAWYFLNG